MFVESFGLEDLTDPAALMNIGAAMAFYSVADQIVDTSGVAASVSEAGEQNSAQVGRSPQVVDGLKRSLN
ncbi:MAG: hypothetical protein J0H40_17040 [Rhizobiales bacterium]|nr:hypothetical protein [Hyphomicrobiales bacterium]